MSAPRPHPMSGRGREIAERMLRPVVESAPPTRMVCETFRPCVSNSLMGFADLRMPSGMRIFGCSVHRKDGRSWVSPPAKEIRDAMGKRTGWTPVIDFVSREAREAWSRAALAAIHEFRRLMPEEPETRHEEWQS